METDSDREVGIAFKDGALFSARAALNKFACDPNNTGKILFSLTRGAFTFIGKVAKTAAPRSASQGFESQRKVAGSAS